MKSMPGKSITNYSLEKLLQNKIRFIFMANTRYTK